MAATPDAILPRYKRVAEEFVVDWDFANDISTGDTVNNIGSGSTVTATQVDNGTDVSAAFLQSATRTGTKLLVQVQGGTAGKSYDVLFHAQTAAGDVFERVVRVPMVAA